MMQCNFKWVLYRSRLKNHLFLLFFFLVLFTCFMSKEGGAFLSASFSFLILSELAMCGHSLDGHT